MAHSIDYKVPPNFNMGICHSQEQDGVLITFSNGYIKKGQRSLISAFNHLAVAYNEYSVVQNWLNRSGDRVDTDLMETEKTKLLKLLRDERERTVQLMSMILQAGAEPLPPNHELDRDVASALGIDGFLRDAAVAAVGGQEAVNDFRVSAVQRMNKDIMRTRPELLEKADEHLVERRKMAAQRAARAQATADSEARAYAQGPLHAAVRRCNEAEQRRQKLRQEDEQRRQQGLAKLREAREKKRRSAMDCSSDSNLIDNSSQRITAKSKYLQELECKCNRTNLSVLKVMEESDWLHKHYNEEMSNMQSAAREHTQRFFQETEKLRNKLAEKESNIKRRSKELNDQVAETDMERRVLEEEKKKNADENDSLNMARIEQQKADECLLQLLEKHKKEKEDALNKILQLERQVDEKQKLELDIEQLKGKLEVVKYMEGEGDSEELIAELNERIEEIEDLEALNQSLVVKHMMSNDEIQDAKKELIVDLADLLGPHSNIEIKRIGELDEKPFVLSCKQRYGEDAEMKAAELVSVWQEHLKDPNWHPFKIVTTGSTTEQIINDKDEKLMGLKEQLGEEVYKAVTTALLDINEYNASGSYMLSELWNNKENRKARITEAIQLLLKQWKAHKRRR